MFAGLKWGRVSLLCIVALSSSLAAAQSSWTYLGPDGGRVTYLIQDAAVPTTLYAGSQGGFFRSTDSGEHWSRMGPVNSYLATGSWPLIQDADVPARFYTTHDGGMSRSDDGGATWTPTGGLPGGDTIIALTDVPGTSEQLFAMSTRWGVLYSADGAQHWVMRNTGLAPGFVPAALAISRSNPTIQLLRRNDAIGYFGAPLYRSTDGGVSWQSTGLSGGGFQPQFALFGAGTRAYAVIGLDLYRSNDLGATWSGPRPLERNPRALVADPNNPDVLLAARDDGVFRTSDAGATWTSLNNGLDANPVSKAGVTALVQDASDPTGMRLWAATDRSGLFRSDDGGAHWTAYVAGLAANSFRAVSIHPRHPARLLAATGEDVASGSGVTLYVSDDDGTTWSPSDLGLLAGLVRDVVIDPTTTTDVASTHVYAVGRWAPGQQRNGGIYRSLDGGAHWTTFDEGLPHYWFGYWAAYLGKVRSIVLDPRSCALPPASGPCTEGPLRTLYVTADGYSGNFGPHAAIYRIARTDDEGASWTDVGGDLPHAWDDGERGEILTPLSLVIDPLNSNLLYLGTYDSVYGSESVAPPAPQLSNGFFRSDDRGEHWLWRSNGLPKRSATTAYDIGALAAHPRRSGVLWAAVGDLEADTPSRIFKTKDGGEHWDATCSDSISVTCGLNNCDVRTLTVDAAAPDVLYAGGYATEGGSGCLFRSEDGGKWWTPISGNAWASAMMDVARDASDPTRFVIGSNTGVWQLRSPSDKIFFDDFGQ